MKLKTVAIMGTILALAACGNATQNPEKLKGGNFVTKSGDMEITLSFAPEDMRINGRALNLYNASYTANGDNINFGDMLSTMMAGPEEEMQAEQEYFQFMSTVEKYNLNGDTLILRNAAGQEIVFTSVDPQSVSDGEIDVAEAAGVSEEVAEAPADASPENAPEIAE